MAIPYPEGEVLVNRTVLHHSSGFDATNESSFYSNALVETYWNGSVRHGNPVSTSGVDHPRTSRRVIDPDVWKTDYVVFTGQRFSFTNDRKGKATRGFCDENNTNANEIRDAEDGGPKKVCLMPVLLGSEKYMFMDLTTPVRAIYFPLSWQCDEALPDICSYLMIDFRLREKISFHVPSQSKWVDLGCDDTTGLGEDVFEWTMGFDLEGVYRYLALPHQLRNPEMGLYKVTAEGESELVWLVANDEITNYPADSEVIVKFDRHMDLADVVSANLGVELVWAPYEFTNWGLAVFTNLTSFALGFIPVVGPLLSVEFTITVTAITDPDYFESSNVLGLPLDILGAVLDSAEGSKKYMTPGFHFATGDVDDTRSVTRSATKSAGTSSARAQRIKGLRAQAEQIGWGPSTWFAERLKSLNASGKAKALKDSRALTSEESSSAGTSGFKMEVSCQNQKLKEYSVSFQ
ncbi:hypothetical protein MMC26_003308 [Xylographa opegraphella]|nr:hypothetical protein [Xylographa opegraphella]